MRALTTFTVFLCLSAIAGTVTLMWPPSPDPVSHYRILIGPTNARVEAEFPTTKDVVLPLGSVDVDPGTYHAAVYAVGTNGVSGPISYSGPFMVKPPVYHAVTIILEGSATPEGPWKLVQTVTMTQPELGDMRIFRARVGIENGGPGPPMPQ